MLLALCFLYCASTVTTYKRCVVQTDNRNGPMQAYSIKTMHALAKAENAAYLNCQHKHKFDYRIGPSKYNSAGVLLNCR